MNWKIAWISEELDDRLEAVCTQKADFCAVAAVRPGQTAFEEDILYVGKSGDIASGAVLTGTCLLLTKSCKDDPALEHRKKACGFLAYAPAHTDAGLLYEKAKELFRKRAAYCSKEAAILALPAKNFSFQQLARELASIFGNPVAISDVSFKTLGYSDNIDVDDDVWNKYTVTNYSPYEYLQIVQDSGLGAVFENSEPQWSSGAKVQHRRLGCKISINNSMVGWTTLLEIKQTFTDYDIDLLKVTALMLSSEFRKDRHYSASRRTPLEVFVTELLEGTNPNRVILRERAKQVTKYVFGKQYLLVFQKTDTSSHYLALLRSELEMIFDKGFTILYGDVLLLFVPERSSRALDAGRIRATAAICEKIQPARRRQRGVLRHPRHYGVLLSRDQSAGSRADVRPNRFPHLPLLRFFHIPPAGKGPARGSTLPTSLTR